ncbi:MAG: thioredoxin domain-containing protein [Candidatus Promineifilaceae bacterium]
MPNQLAQETSPYLLQHADNPVEWLPWGPEALARARKENKPILLSIGYAACHWCHVMAHESFEDPVTAAFMNEHFINVKVDREERPDLDSIYMNAVVQMTGQGGWPLTAILTPEGEPIFGGTYFPPTARHGMPAFRQVLTSVARAWQEQRGDLAAGAADLAASLGQAVRLTAGNPEADAGLLRRAEEVILRSYDATHGGFGPAPKFPQPMTLEFLLRRGLQAGSEAALAAATQTLTRMAQGGMYDQLGGGFARYSVDERWQVPHFEKMLYDNALLARVYLHAWQMTGEPLFRQVVEETLDWALREMRQAEGGFYSSLDADSEGVEGKFYVWSAAEIRDALGDDAEVFMRYYGVTEAGNWEGTNILHVARPIEAVAQALGRDQAELRASVERGRSKLLALRGQRVRPGTDDKVLTAWNAFLLAALAEAGRVLGRADYTQAASANAEFLLRALRRPDGRLLRTWKAGGQGRLNAYLEDYAALASALLTLYQRHFDPRWYTWSLELVELMLAHFRDEANGGFFDTSDDHEQLIRRPKDVQDNATPSGNALAVEALLQHALLSGRGEFWDRAQAAISGLYPVLAQYPTGFAQWLCVADFLVAQPVEVAVAGPLGRERTQALLDVVLRPHRPHLVVAAGEDGDVVPLLAGRKEVDGGPAAYVCRRFACQAPVVLPEALAAALDEAAGHAN